MEEIPLVEPFGDRFGSCQGDFRNFGAGNRCLRAEKVEEIPLVEPFGDRFGSCQRDFRNFGAGNRCLKAENMEEIPLVGPVGDKFGPCQRDFRNFGAGNRCLKAQKWRKSPWSNLSEIGLVRARGIFGTSKRDESKDRRSRQRPEDRADCSGKPSTCRRPLPT